MNTRLPCPDCANPIPVDVQALLGGKQFACLRCDARIGLSPASSSQLRAAIDKMQALRTPLQ